MKRGGLTIRTYLEAYLGAHLFSRGTFRVCAVALEPRLEEGNGVSVDTICSQRRKGIFA